MLYSLSFYLYIHIFTEDPVNPSLDPVLHLVWLEISLFLSLLLLYIYIYYVKLYIIGKGFIRDSDSFYSKFHVTWTTFKFNRNKLGTVTGYVM